MDVPDISNVPDISKLIESVPTLPGWPEGRTVCFGSPGLPVQDAVWKNSSGDILALLKGSVKNNLVEFAPEFAVDLIDLIEQNLRNSELFRGLLRLKIG
ncbi:MAG: hypothetical protein LWX54_04790 [Deltaproteobacteria bacterium]|jgi:hypothetical protein|nr:hypothetical protein [Deltaproteobacteria bacterium]